MTDPVPTKRAHCLNVAALHAALDARRERRGLTWRQVAQEAGVSASTLTRLGQGMLPSVDGLLLLLAWLDNMVLAPFLLPAPDRQADCPFCDRDKSLIIAYGRWAYVTWDAYPAADGHALVVPHRHAKSIMDMDSAEMSEVMRLAQEHMRAHPADGWTVGWNVGTAAGQTVSHAHLHLIPRRHGDVPDPRGGIRAVLPHTNTPEEWTP